MKRWLAVLFFVFAAGLGAPATARADTELTGQAGQAFYRIVVPDPWNGDLVIWNHGFSLSPPGPVTDLGPLAPLQLAEGYAIAASSYRMSGWALFKTNQDLEALYQTFVGHFGAPGRVLVTGASLGGAVTAAAIESAELGNVVGAYSLCGALAGSRNWDLGVDVRIIYDTVCANTFFATIPGGPEGLPAGSTLTSTHVALAVNECMGVLTHPDLRTPTQRSNLADFRSLTGVPENFVLTVMGYVTFGLADLVHDQAKLRGRVGTGTAGVTYGEPLDSMIPRYEAHRGAAHRLDANYSPSGDVRGAKIVTLHTDKDALMVVENEDAYASVVPAANLTVAVAVETIPSHCGFSEREVIAGWESLRSWVAGGPQPTPASIQAACQVIPASGGCRIDPAYVVPAVDTRMLPR